MMLPAGLRIFFAAQPIDMRCSIDGLVVAVAERLKTDAAVVRAFFVFTNANRDRIKILWRETSGWCVLYKRFEGHRVLPPTIAVGDTSIALDTRQLQTLLDGMKTRASVKEIVREARRRVSIK